MLSCASIVAHSPLARCTTTQTSVNTGSGKLRSNDLPTLSGYGGSTMDLALPSDFREFLRLLNENLVEYLLIAGYAVGYYGYPLQA